MNSATGGTQDRARDRGVATSPVDGTTLAQERGSAVRLVSFNSRGKATMLLLFWQARGALTAPTPR